MQLLKVLQVNGDVTKIKASLDGSILTTLSDKRIIEFWDSTNFTQLDSLSVAASIRDYAFSGRMNKLAIIRADDSPRQHCTPTSQALIYHLPDKALLATQEMADIRSVVYLEEQRTWVLGRVGHDKPFLNSFDFCDSYLNVTHPSIDLPTPELPFDLALLPQLKLWVTLGIGLTVWRTADHSLLCRFNCQNIPVSWDIWETTCFCVEPQHNLLAIGFDAIKDRPPGPNICLVDATTWQIQGWFGDGVKYPQCIALSQDGKRLAAILGEGQPLRVWNIADEMLLDELEPRPITTVAFGADSHYLLTGGTQPEALCLWKLAR